MLTGAKPLVIGRSADKRHSMLEGLDRVDWASLTHAYGEATLKGIAKRLLRHLPKPPAS